MQREHYNSIPTSIPLDARWANSAGDSKIEDGGVPWGALHGDTPTGVRVANKSHRYSQSTARHLFAVDARHWHSSSVGYCSSQHCTYWADWHDEQQMTSRKAAHTTSDVSDPRPKLPWRKRRNLQSFSLQLFLYLAAARYQN